jgi:putative intracellular protease/amidase
MRLLSSLLLATSLLIAPFVALGADQAKVQTAWVCPMSEHAQEFDQPGTCPLCGMTLVEKSRRFRVAVLLFNYVEDIDFAAPVEVFGQAGAEVFTVAATMDPVRTVFALHVKPDYDLAHAPAADLILVPGGGVNTVLKDEPTVAWVRQRATESRYVMSVCNGTFILGKAGLLDGLTATTTAGRIDELAEASPKTHVVRQRFVDNGKVITTAGLSAGIDGSLHVIEREYGRPRAEEVARGIEYRWEPESKWTRATYADMHLPDVHLPDDAHWQKLGSQGDTEHWEMHGRLQVPMAQEEFLDYSTKQIVALGWTLRESKQGTRTFAKKDRDGQTWVTTLASVPDTAPSTYLETMAVRKASGS